MSDLVLSFAISFWLSIVVEGPVRYMATKLLLGNR